MQLTILGSTGSIGTQTLDVAARRGYAVTALAAGRNLDTLAAQVARFSPRVVSVSADVLPEARRRFSGLRVISDVNEVAALPADVCVNAIGGLAGLSPTRAALEAGRAVALATKEAMVAAPNLIWQAARGGGRVVPVDSEHTGVYQCLAGENIDDVEEVLLTASGGPFRSGPEDLSAVTPEQALKHPNYSMGRKITVDSATMFNKGLEVMECAGLYGLPMSRVGVLVHPQQALHALLRFRDGNLKAQLGPADMRLSIAYAIDAAQSGMRWPGDVRGARRGGPVGERARLSGTWELSEPDLARFPCLALAYRAGELGGAAPAALNAADEVAVAAFLEGRAGFLDIPRVLEAVLKGVTPQTLSWESLPEVDGWARARAKELL